MKQPPSVPPLIPAFSPQEEKELKPKSVGIYDAIQSRHPSLKSAGILRLSERCLSEASLANAQNTEERKDESAGADSHSRRLPEGRGTRMYRVNRATAARDRVDFSLIRFAMPCGCFWPLKRNEHVAFRKRKEKPTCSNAAEPRKILH